MGLGAWRGGTAHVEAEAQKAPVDERQTERESAILTFNTAYCYGDIQRGVQETQGRAAEAV